MCKRGTPSWEHRLAYSRQRVGAGWPGQSVEESLTKRLSLGLAGSGWGEDSCREQEWQDLVTWHSYISRRHDYWVFPGAVAHKVPLPLVTFLSWGTFKSPRSTGKRPGSSTSSAADCHCRFGQKTLYVFTCFLLCKPKGLCEIVWGGSPGPVSFEHLRIRFPVHPHPWDLSHPKGDSRLP